MNAGESFPIGARVVLLEDQKRLPFWKADRFREGIGTIEGELRNETQRVRMLRGNWTKVFFLRPSTLSPCPAK